jgi:hypothetical protein
MPSSPVPGPVTPASVEARTSQLAERLATALAARGLRARVSRGAWVLASNPAGDPPDGDHHAKALNPGLRQTVMCGADGDGRLLWFWQWSGPTRESPPEYEPLCAAEDISQAAEKIARVLRVVPPASQEER